MWGNWICAEKNAVSSYVPGARNAMVSGNNNRPYTNGLTTLFSITATAKWQRFGNNLNYSKNLELSDFDNRIALFVMQMKIATICFITHPC